MSGETLAPQLKRINPNGALTISPESAVALNAPLKDRTLIAVALPGKTIVFMGPATPFVILDKLVRGSDVVKNAQRRHQNGETPNSTTQRLTLPGTGESTVNPNRQINVGKKRYITPPTYREYTVGGSVVFVPVNKELPVEEVVPVKVMENNRKLEIAQALPYGLLVEEYLLWEKKRAEQLGASMKGERRAPIIASEGTLLEQHLAQSLRKAVARNWSVSSAQ